MEPALMNEDEDILNLLEKEKLTEQEEQKLFGALRSAQDQHREFNNSTEHLNLKERLQRRIFGTDECA